MPIHELEPMMYVYWVEEEFEKMEKENKMNQKKLPAYTLKFDALKENMKGIAEGIEPALKHLNPNQVDEIINEKVNFLNSLEGENFDNLLQQAFQAPEVYNMLSLNVKMQILHAIKSALKTIAKNKINEIYRENLGG